MYTYISTKQKPYFNNFNYKEHHKNIYTFINTKIKTLFLTIKNIIIINTHTLTPNKNPILKILTIKSIIIINTHTLTPNKNFFIRINKHK